MAEDGGREEARGGRQRRTGKRASRRKKPNEAGKPRPHSAVELSD